MTAFLDELKTVRLRKVNDGAGGPSKLSKSTSALSFGSDAARPAKQELLRRRSLVDLQSMASTSVATKSLVAGQKRKADEMEVDRLTTSRTSISLVSLPDVLSGAFYRSCQASVDTGIR